MPKTKKFVGPPKLPPKIPHWVSNLRRLMDELDLNPRSLSLKAGLNATAVRDMLEGRSRFPRYDTAQALAKALQTTPARLMSDANTAGNNSSDSISNDDLDLLTEIIGCLQEVTGESNRKLSPHDFAAMAVSIYQRIQVGEASKSKISTIRSQIHELLDYEKLRQKRTRN